MQGLSNATADDIYQHIFGKVTYTAPATIYVAMAKGTVAESDTGATFDEADYGGYARVALTNNTTNFPAPTDGAGYIATEVTFPVVASSPNTIVEIILLDSGTIGAGNIIGGGALTVASALVVGQEPAIKADTFGITVI